MTVGQIVPLHEIHPSNFSGIHVAKDTPLIYEGGEFFGEDYNEKIKPGFRLRKGGNVIIYLGMDSTRRMPVIRKADLTGKDILNKPCELMDSKLFESYRLLSNQEKWMKIE